MHLFDEANYERLRERKKNLHKVYGTKFSHYLNYFIISIGNTLSCFISYFCVNMYSFVCSPQSKRENGNKENTKQKVMYIVARQMIG